ncbi:MAG: GGDEF domain-containing protein [Rhizobiales bacterium]|nr:GGDEF domain-containing protein [Hyphomicrobiales bacterium]OJY07045.1 MAG: GGDEF domain-containing protein [Rhizobiales bacterium 63-22]
MEKPFVGGADFILIINMAVSGLFSCAFFAIAFFAKGNAAARIFGIGFACAMLYSVIVLSMPALPGHRLGYLLAFSTYLFAMACLVAGLARMYGERPPWVMLGVLVAGSLVLVYSVYGIARSTIPGMLAYQTPYFLLMALAAWTVLRARPKRAMDTFMGVLIGLSALHFLFKPLLAAMSGGPGTNPADYTGTLYALFTLSISVGLSVAVGLLLLLNFVRALIAEITMRSETDQLSELLNRRGFELRADAAIEKSRKARQALSLVVCDIDFFKSVNDTYGHATGDRVIVVFAAELRKLAVAQGGIAARLGGEEFAVLLPGQTMQSAWRFAEGARLACGGIHVPSGIGDVAFSVSFGVAEMEFDDTFSDLYKRADGALYAAKNAGRDCVQSAPVILPDENVIMFRPSGSTRARG